ncbi:palmitoyltransferase swf1 [Anaeramoeba ignava]|uniref:Palmitoyltransferase n=1 Tax=Anaeramoeba ignava TaxID=1746090 RepID=A0A9Q0LGH4_ANAIG|nr:palmitoyltransferase swf1 [Anaeramoeba ignava]
MIKLEWFLIGYTSFLVFFVYVLLFGQSDYHRNGIIGFLYQFLSYKIFIYFRLLITKCFGKRMETRLDNFSHYFLQTKNPFLMIFYLVVLFGGLTIFFISVFPEMFFCPTLSNLHIFYLIIILSLVFGSFLICVYSDPGIITSENVNNYLKLYPYDYMIYLPKECSTCKLPKPARSKHCRFLNKCIARYDHYCGWVANSIGELNYRYFILFLFSNFAMCVYGSYFMFKILSWKIYESQFFVQQISEYEDSLKDKPKLQDYIEFLLENYRTISGLFLLVTLMAIVVFAFTLYHLYLISKNTTTVESFKFSEFKQFLQQLASENKVLMVNTNLVSPQKSKNSKKRKKSKNEDNLNNVVPLDPNNLKNIYNVGIIGNFLEVFFPKSRRIQKSKTKSLKPKKK